MAIKNVFAIGGNTEDVVIIHDDGRIFRVTGSCIPCTTRAECCTYPVPNARVMEHWPVGRRQDNPDRCVFSEDNGDCRAHRLLRGTVYKPWHCRVFPSEPADVDRPELTCLKVFTPLTKAQALELIGDAIPNGVVPL